MTDEIKAGDIVLCDGEAETRFVVDDVQPPFPGQFGETSASLMKIGPRHHGWEPVRKLRRVENPWRTEESPNGKRTVIIRKIATVTVGGPEPLEVSDVVAVVARLRNADGSVEPNATLAGRICDFLNREGA